MILSQMLFQSLLITIIQEYLFSVCNGLTNSTPLHNLTIRRYYLPRRGTKFTEVRNHKLFCNGGVDCNLRLCRGLQIAHTIMGWISIYNYDGVDYNLQSWGWLQLIYCPVAAC